MKLRAATTQATKLLRELERQGWRVKHGSKHYVVFPPDKSKPPYTIPGTARGGCRSWENTIAGLRRLGAKL